MSTVPRVYLDWNATAPLRSSARAAWLAAQDQDWANPSSIHDEGQSARHGLDQGRNRVGQLLGCKAHELVITSGGTEANALALHAARIARPGAVVASAIDHSSVLRNANLNHADPEDQDRLRLVPVDGQGRLLPTTLAEHLDGQESVVCLQLANNELGTCQDVPALVAEVRARSPLARVHLDACQGTGKIPVDLRSLGVDTAAIAGHKFGAPKGIGLLYARNGVVIHPLVRGGRQQQDRRSGTEDPAAFLALVAALEESLGQAHTEAQRQRQILEACFARIQEQVPQAVWLARDATRLANTLSLGCPGVRNEVLVQRLDLAGFAVSTGAACMAARGAPSHVIAALGTDPEVARSVIRVSIGHLTTDEQLQRFATAYAEQTLSLLAAAVSTAPNLPTACH